MTLFLSVPEFLSQHDQIDEFDQVVYLPWTIPLKDVMGNSYGYRQTVNLRQGLNVLIDDYTLQEDLIVKPPCEGEAWLRLEMSFMLSGHNYDEEMQSCHNFLTASWDSGKGGQFHWQAGERVLKFDIHMEPNFFNTLLNEQFGALPSLLRQIIKSSQPNHHPFWHRQPTTAAMRSVIHQILHCPYQGLTRWLYWEGKVLELIALRLEQVCQSDLQLATVSGLHAGDIDRIYYASDILLQGLDNPPSLLELSRLVGLNDYKLKQGFRQVFGTTVFGYLQTHRMERACQLLKQQKPIAMVAASVGYASPTAFSGAFRRHLGVSPKEYQLSKHQ